MNPRVKNISPDGITRREQGADTAGSACLPPVEGVRLDAICAELRELAECAREDVTIPEGGPFRELLLT